MMINATTVNIILVRVTYMIIIMIIITNGRSVSGGYT